MIQARVELRGFEEFRRYLDRHAEKLTDLRPLMEEIGRRMVSITQARINEGIDPPNAPLTRKWKKGNNTPLRDTGALLASITYRAGDDFVAWGSNLPYAAIQQLGGEIRAKRAKKLAIPAGWHTRRLMRRYGETPEKCLEGLRRVGWRIWFTDKAIMGQPPRKRGKAKPVVLFVRREAVEIPARPYLRFEEREKQAVLEAFREWLSR